MIFRKIAISGLLGASALLASGTASAVAITSWSQITSNGNQDVSNQLVVDVTAVGGTQVMFEFRNNIGIASTITDVYFDDKDDALLLDLDSISASAGVSFSEGAAPPNLPGGNTVDFAATFSADSNAPTSGNGINSAIEWLRITFDLVNGMTFDDVLAELNDGELVIGMHVQAIGQAGGSESFINDPGDPNPVPEPASLLLLGAGLLGLAAARRRRV